MCRPWEGAPGAKPVRSCPEGFPCWTSEQSLCCRPGKVQRRCSGLVCGALGWPWEHFEGLEPGMVVLCLGLLGHLGQVVSPLSACDVNSASEYPTIRYNQLPSVNTTWDPG